MYFSRVQIKPGPEMFNIIKRNRFENGYAVHQLLWSLFPNDGKRKGISCTVSPVRMVYQASL